MRTLLILLVLATPAAAQDASSHRAAITIPTVVFGAAAASDWAATYTMLHAHNGPQHRTHEANPLLRWSEHQPVRMIAIGAAGDAVGVWVWHKAVGRNHPKLYAVGLYAGSALRAYLVYLNVRTIREVRAVPTGR